MLYLIAQSQVKRYVLLTFVFDTGLEESTGTGIMIRVFDNLKLFY